MKLKDAAFFLITFALAATSVLYTFTVLTAFSGFAAGLMKAVLGILFFYAFDKILLKEVDTVNELIQKQNIAYAIFILGFALIIAATVATA